MCRTWFTFLCLLFTSYALWQLIFCYGMNEKKNTQQHDDDGMHATFITTVQKNRQDLENINALKWRYFMWIPRFCAPRKTFHLRIGMVRWVNDYIKSKWDFHESNLNPHLNSVHTCFIHCAEDYLQKRVSYRVVSSIFFFQRNKIDRKSLNQHETLLLAQLLAINKQPEGRPFKNRNNK